MKEEVYINLDNIKRITKNGSATIYIDGLYCIALNYIVNLLLIRKTLKVKVVAKEWRNGTLYFINSLENSPTEDEIIKHMTF